MLWGGRRTAVLHPRCSTEPRRYPWVRRSDDGLGREDRNQINIIDSFFMLKKSIISRPSSTCSASAS